MDILLECKDVKLEWLDGIIEHVEIYLLIRFGITIKSQ